jgi:hypothetical protein
VECPTLPESVQRTTSYLTNDAEPCAERSIVRQTSLKTSSYVFEVRVTIVYVKYAVAIRIMILARNLLYEALI